MGFDQTDGYDSIPNVGQINGNENVALAISHEPFWRLRMKVFIGVAVAVVAITTAALVNTRSSAMDGGVASQELESFSEGQKSSWTFSNHIPLLGKHKKSKKDKDPYTDLCYHADYSKTTLKTAYHMPFAALFEDTRGQKKFEASDVIQVGDYIYAICDNSWAISRFHKSLTPFHPENVQLGDPSRDPTEDSGYEAIFHHQGVFYVVRESVPHYAHASSSDDDDTVDNSSTPSEPCYHAVVEEIVLVEGNDYQVMEQCSCAYEFEGTSKGFEGAVGVTDTNDELVILGLCEGNHCSEERKFDRGNGKLIAMKKNTTMDGNATSCVWETVAEIDIPASANFLDYSAIAMTSTGRVAITSQEDSVVWIGQLTGLDAAGRLDWGVAALDPLAGEVYAFGRSDVCTTKYCNVEGIHFLNDDMLIGVSDKMKSKGKQDYRCMEMDQSVHVFVLP